MLALISLLFKTYSNKLHSFRTALLEAHGKYKIMANLTDIISKKTLSERLFVKHNNIECVWIENYSFF